MEDARQQISRRVVFAVGLVVLSWLFFAPIASFHHLIACGILAPIVLNGETPQGGHLLWGEYEVCFFPGRFGTRFILWISAVLLLFRLSRRKQITRQQSH
jgi:hypothetical protein